MTSKRGYSPIHSTSQRSKDEGIGSVVASHYNKIEEKGMVARTESKIINLRNFNNWIKSVMIDKFLTMVREEMEPKARITVLDLGCGKGGDLMKWLKGGIDHFIGADIAGTSVAQCEERYNFTSTRQNVFTAEFIVADCTKAKLKPHFSDPKMQVDIVSSQFAFHYCFESLPQAETMIQNISESLKKGGIFIATSPNDVHIVSLLERNGGRVFKNKVFQIEFPEDRPKDPPLFGDQYNFFLEGVVNCPEFLVHFPTLVRLCKKYGLELIYNKPFADIYQESIRDEKYLSLMFKMRALEMFFTNNERAPHSEYEHAKNFAKLKGQHKVKTLSKSEWEATCVYRGFAFKKVRESCSRKNESGSPESSSQDKHVKIL